MQPITALTSTATDDNVVRRAVEAGWIMLIGGERDAAVANSPRHHQ